MSIFYTNKLYFIYIFIYIDVYLFFNINIAFKISKK